MLTTHTIYNPHHRTATGEPYAVKIRVGGSSVEVPACTAEEAGEIRDSALDAGYTTRILGLPTRLAAAGFGSDVEQLPDVAG
jgi:hypothetical protein